MTDEQLLRYYDHQGRYNARRVERYNSDPAYRERRLQQSLAAQRRQRERRRLERQARNATA